MRNDIQPISEIPNTDALETNRQAFEEGAAKVVKGCYILSVAALAGAGAALYYDRADTALLSGVAAAFLSTLPRAGISLVMDGGLEQPYADLL